MFFGFGLIATSYIILVVVGIWLLSNRELGIRRVLVVPFLIWYGLVVYIGSEYVMGYPTASTMRDNTIIVALRIVEPTTHTKGGIYFWGIPAEKIADKTSVPRSFSLPYDVELHKQLMRKKEGENGMLVWKRKKRGAKRKRKKGGSIGESEGRFEILNPSKILTKTK